MRGAVVLLFGVAACGGKIDWSETATTTAGPSPTSQRPAPDDVGATNEVAAAYAYAGGLDHVMIYAPDPTSDSCVTMHLTRPQTARTLDSVAMPKGWGVASAERSRSAKSCGPGRNPPAAETAIDGKGTIDFAASDSALPCTLASVKVTLVFDDRPTTDLVVGDDVPVAGCE